jgi:hypothetical protein
MKLLAPRRPRLNDLRLSVSGLVLACLLMTGCDTRKSVESAFETAASDLRVKAQEAVRLDQSNEYMRAAERYDSLLREEVTPDQKRAVQTAIHKLYSRMCKAAASGDSDAKRTLATIEARRKADHS